MSASPLEKIMNPASVAFVGASNNIQTMGTIHLNNLLGSGFRGPVYPVHPSEKIVLGLAAYPDIDSLPAVPDLLVMLVNRKLLPDLMDQAGQKGIRHAVVISGGFAESSGSGTKLQDQLREVTRRHGIHVIGPNCIGVVNPWAPMNVTYFPYEGSPGDIGLISHSGTYLCHMYGYLARRGLGLAGGMSLGNELNMDLVDGIAHFGRDERARSIALYIEAIRRPREFIRTAREVGARKPVVALHVGSSEAGARAASSHTAALSGGRGILEGVLDQAGVIRARGIQELYDFAGTLAKQPVLKGKRIAVLTNSGGPGASSAEALEGIGLSCPELSESTQAKIRALQPHTASAHNPVDFTYSIDMEAFYVHTPKILMEDPQIDGLLLYGAFGVGFWRYLIDASSGRLDLPDMEPMERMMDYLLRTLADLPHTYGKPLLVVNVDGFADDATDKLRSYGVPVLPSPERAAAALMALHRYHRIRQRSS